MLLLWFEAVPDMPNTYKVRKAYHHFLQDVVDGTEVTFTSVDPNKFPLPDPRYLAFHAALAKVIHMAGIDEHLDDILEECHGSIQVLSEGSELEYFDRLLHEVTLRQR